MNKGIEEKPCYNCGKLKTALNSKSRCLTCVSESLEKQVFMNDELIRALNCLLSDYKVSGFVTDYSLELANKALSIHQGSHNE